MVEQATRAARARRPPRQRGRLSRSGQRAVAEAVRSCAPGADAGAAMTVRRRSGRAPTSASATGSAGPAVVLVNGGTAKAVPGTWSATSELLATELAPRFPDARLRGGALPAQDVARARLVHGGRPAQRSTSLERPSLLVGFSMGGAVSIGVASAPDGCRRARPGAMDPRPAPARRPPGEAARRAPRRLGPVVSRHSRASARRARGTASSARGGSGSRGATGSSPAASTAPRSGAARARSCACRGRRLGRRGGRTARALPARTRIGPKRVRGSGFTRGGARRELPR